MPSSTSEFDLSELNPNMCIVFSLKIDPGPGMEEYTFNASTWKAEAGNFCEPLTSLVYIVLG